MSSFLTEAEAKEKWCPHVRAAAVCDYEEGQPGLDSSIFHGGGFNRLVGVGCEVPCRCIGSKCMAWRWANKADSPWPLKVYADVPETVEFIINKSNELKETEMDALVDGIIDKYTHNPPERPEDVPESWVLGISFDQWWDYDRPYSMYGCRYVYWVEPEEDAVARVKAERRGYCGLAGKTWEIKAREAGDE